MEQQLNLIPPALTDRQQAVLDFIKGHIALNGYSPSMGDIGRHFDFMPTAARAHIKALVKKGRVNIVPGVVRSITLIKNNQ